MPDIPVLKIKIGACPETEYSPGFIQGMVNRMAVSYHKYGALEIAYPHKLSALHTLDAAIAKYRESKNTEYLIDAANYLMIEFMHPSVDGAHFEGTDHDRSIGRMSNQGPVGSITRNEEL